MIDTFMNWFEGTWENKIQAFSFPAKYAMVRLIHKKVENTSNLFYGEQAYNYSLHAPYRQFAVEVNQENEFLRIKNYSFDKTQFVGFKNLDKLKDNLTYKCDCDTILTFNGVEFSGSVQGCRCFVEFDKKTTYVKNEVVLGESYYHVVDKGYLLGTTTQVWGGKYGPFKFQKNS